MKLHFRILWLVSLLPMIAFVANAHAEEIEQVVSLIPRGPGVKTRAEGQFTIKYDTRSQTNRVVITGEVKKLSSELIVPGSASSEIHLHHFPLLTALSPTPPIIKDLVVQKSDGGRSAEFTIDFEIAEQFTPLLLNGMTFVLIHTRDNPRGEVVGYVAGLPGDGADLDLDQIQRDHPLLMRYRQLAAKPVLPLSPNESDPYLDAPFPSFAALENSPELIDSRTEKERYLRLKVPQVQSGSVVAGDRDTGFNSFYDHPNVQSRPFRPMHLRYASPLKSEMTDRIVSSRPGQNDPTAGEVDSAKIQKYLPFLELAPMGPRTFVETPPAMFPEVDPFRTPPGTNLLPTVYENMRDRTGREMVNTLPSHPNRPYNLHDGEPEVERLDTLSSPTDDLRLIMDDMYESITGEPVRRLWEKLDKQTLEEIFENISDEQHEQRIAEHRKRLLHQAEWAIDILEGNEGRVVEAGQETRESRIPGNRAYRGFALLHHSGHKRSNRVTPIYDQHGEIKAGHVYIRQIWYDGRIESDTMFYDYGWDDLPIRVRTNGANDYEIRWFSSTDSNLNKEHWKWSRNQTVVRPDQIANLQRMPEPIPHDVPLQATYEISVLNRGEDDFSPSIIYFDAHEKVRDDIKLADGATNDGKNNLCAPNPAAKDVNTGVAAEYPWGKLNVDGHNVSMRYGPPHVAMDATFFPLQEGTRTRVKLKLADAQYHNVHYTWGWRKHPPRAQAVENMHKRLPPNPGSELKNHYRILWDHATAETFFGNAITNKNLAPRLFRLRIDDHERFVFEGIQNIDLIVERYLQEEMVRCPAELSESVGHHQQRVRKMVRADFDALSKLKWLQPPPDGNPIAKLSDLSPAKQMWRAFRNIRQSLQDDSETLTDCLYDVLEARDAFLDWNDRNHLPRGLKVDSKTDLTMLFVNNTMYGESSDGSPTRLKKWRTRGTNIDLTLLNGDYFIHGYVNPDFGGLRGYENQFKPTLALGGQGSLFTFGRFNWRFNVAGGAIPVPPAHLEKLQADGEYKQIPLLDVGTFNRWTQLNDQASGPTKMPEHVVVPGVHRLRVRYNFEPSRRLRFYQFDPLHHDVAIYSVH